MVCRAKVKEHFRERTVLRWSVQLFQALEYLHGLLLIHRDVKTANLFLTKSGVLKLGDFGVAKRFQTTSSDPGSRTTATPVGTPLYMAPEVLRMEPYSMAADNWAAGCCLYEMCALRPAFVGRSLTELVSRVKRGETCGMLPTMLYSAELVELVTALLSVDPGVRPTAAEVVSSELISAQVPSSPLAAALAGTPFRPYSPDASSNGIRQQLGSKSEIFVVRHDSASPTILDIYDMEGIVDSSDWGREVVSGAGGAAARGGRHFIFAFWYLSPVFKLEHMQTSYVRQQLLV